MQPYNTILCLYIMKRWGCSANSKNPGIVKYITQILAMIQRWCFLLSQHNFSQQPQVPKQVRSGSVPQRGKEKTHSLFSKISAVAAHPFGSHLLYAWGSYALIYVFFFGVHLVASEGNCVFYALLLHCWNPDLLFGQLPWPNSSISNTKQSHIVFSAWTQHKQCNWLAVTHTHTYYRFLKEQHPF